MARAMNRRSDRTFDIFISAFQLEFSLSFVGAQLQKVGWMIIGGCQWALCKYLFLFRIWTRDPTCIRRRRADFVLSECESKIARNRGWIQHGPAPRISHIPGPRSSCALHKYAVQQQVQLGTIDTSYLPIVHRSFSDQVPGPPHIWRPRFTSVLQVRRWAHRLELQRTTHQVKIFVRSGEVNSMWRITNLSEPSIMILHVAPRSVGVYFVYCILIIYFIGNRWKHINNSSKA